MALKMAVTNTIGGETDERTVTQSTPTPPDGMTRKEWHEYLAKLAEEQSA